MKLINQLLLSHVCLITSSWIGDLLQSHQMNVSLDLNHSAWQKSFWEKTKGGRQKNRSFYGQADRKGLPPPPYGQGVVIFSK